jgi:hypothetical protein
MTYVNMNLQSVTWKYSTLESNILIFICITVVTFYYIKIIQAPGLFCQGWKCQRLLSIPEESTVEEQQKDATFFSL